MSGSSDFLGPADDNDNFQSGQSEIIAPVRGAGAVKAIFGPQNKWRLIFGGFALIVMITAMISSFVGLEKDDIPAVGKVEQGVKANTFQSSGANSQAQKEEADNYNTNQLPKEQESNPKAHPVVLLQDSDAQDDGASDNPFEVESQAKNVQKITDIGSSTKPVSPAKSGSNKAGSAVNAQDAANMDRLVKSLLESEGDAAPAPYNTDWKYAAVSSSSDVEGGAYVIESATDSDMGGKSGADASQANSSCSVKVERAGQMAMATTDIALNSDVEGPVSVTIRSGKLRNVQLIGAFERKEEFLRLELTKLVTPTSTLSIKAIGLDMKTTLNAVAGNVDSHLMYRYGWWGMGTVLKAVGVAGQAAAQSSTTVSDGVVVQDMKASTSQQLQMALGSVGQDIGSTMQDRLNRPITVTLNVGDEIGVFFLDDVCDKASEE